MAAAKNPRIPHVAARADISDGHHTCTKCSERKLLSAFAKRSGRPLGINSTCKACIKVANKVSYAANAQKNCAYAKAYRKDNVAKVAALQADYRDANRDALRQYFRDYAVKNPGAALAKAVTRRAQKLSATPGWANPIKIRGFYDALKLLGKGWHVDHIVPLNHKLVCGLHCEANLQLLPAIENLRKGNRVWPDMP